MTHLGAAKHTTLTPDIVKRHKSVWSCIIRISSSPLLASAVSVLYFMLYFSLSVCPFLIHIIQLPLLLVGLWLGDLFVGAFGGGATFSGLSPLPFSQASLICIDVYLLPPQSQNKRTPYYSVCVFLHDTVSRFNCWREFISTDIWSLLKWKYSILMQTCSLALIMLLHLSNHAEARSCWLNIFFLTWLYNGSRWCHLRYGENIYITKNRYRVWNGEILVYLFSFSVF